MIVYLVPVGADRHELYCEEALEQGEVVADVSSGPVARLVAHFRSGLARIEQEREAPAAASGGRPRGIFGRLKDWTLSKLTEIVAEQRVLWHLRKERDAEVLYPDDLSETQAADVVRRSFQRDADRHRLWLAVYAMAFLASGLVAILPGPNLLAYYFAFRLVGHYLSMTGARHGLSGVRWTRQPNRSLTEFRHAISLGGPERDLRVAEVASTLRLPHLARFFKRVAVPRA